MGARRVEQRAGRRAYRTGVGACVAAALLLIAPACAAASLPLPRRAFSQTAPVAIVPGGAVWFDRGPVIFQTFDGAARRVGWGRTVETIVSSGSAVAGLLGEGRFVGGVAPGPLRPMYQPPPVATGECEGGWQPAASRGADFVLARTQIIAAGECVSSNGTTSETEGAALQPLFLHDVRGGEWRIWRWLRGGFAPVLASEASRVAIGEPLAAPAGSGAVAATRHMRVSITGMRRRGRPSRFIVPFGKLAFASPDRLVLMVAETAAAAPHEATRPSASSGSMGAPMLRARARTSDYRAYLYSTGGRRIADLGVFGGVPLVSHMHLIATEEQPFSEESLLTVRRIPGGAPVPLVGFSGRQRELAGSAFDWPALVLDETTAAVLDAEQVSCRTGYYSEPSPPFLHVIDLAAAHAYEPAPSPSPLVAQNLLAEKHCPRIAVAPRRCG
jgi:hypothetical protein